MSEKKTILVTGGTGYIGSHTVVELLDKGYEVVVVDNLSNSRVEALDGIEKITGRRPQFEKIDLRDIKKIKEVFKKYKIDAVIHFAALKAVEESVKDPLRYYNNNITSLLNLLEVMKENHVRRIVYSSSACVYGETNESPVSESTQIKKANNPYGNTKIISENILSDLSKIGGLEVVALRYFNPIGAHESSAIGELPLGKPDNLVPYVTQTAAGVRDELSIFGNDYETKDGYCVRDFIHVVDLAEAHIKALRRLEKGGREENFEVFNLGTGMGYSVKELVDAFKKVNNVKLKYRVVDRRKGDVPVLYANPEKAKEILNWRAKRDLEEMLRSAWEWEKRYRKL